MSKLFLFLLLVSLMSLSYSAPPVLRCSTPAGEIRYQMSACPAGFSQALLPMHDAPTRSAAAPSERSTPAALVPASRPTASRRVAKTVPARAVGKHRGRRKKRHLEASLSQAGCPPTYEDAGSYVVSKRWMKTPSGPRSKAHAGLRAAWGDYKNLPTKTYLKNAGLWPKNCPP